MDLVRDLRSIYSDKIITLNRLLQTRHPDGVAIEVPVGVAQPSPDRPEEDTTSYVNVRQPAVNVLLTMMRYLLAVGLDVTDVHWDSELVGFAFHDFGVDPALDRKIKGALVVYLFPAATDSPGLRAIDIDAMLANGHVERVVFAGPAFHPFPREPEPGRQNVNLVASPSNVFWDGSRDLGDAVSAAYGLSIADGQQGRLGVAFPYMIRVRYEPPRRRRNRVSFRQLQRIAVQASRDVGPRAGASDVSPEPIRQLYVISVIIHRHSHLPGIRLYDASGRQVTSDPPTTRQSPWSVTDPACKFFLVYTRLDRDVPLVHTVEMDMGAEDGAALVSSGASTRTEFAEFTERGEAHRQEVCRQNSIRAADIRRLEQANQREKERFSESERHLRGEVRRLEEEVKTVQSQRAELESSRRRSDERADAVEKAAVDWLCATTGELPRHRWLDFLSSYTRPVPRLPPFSDDLGERLWTVEPPWLKGAAIEHLDAPETGIHDKVARLYRLASGSNWDAGQVVRAFELLRLITLDVSRCAALRDKCGVAHLLPELESRFQGLLATRKPLAALAAFALGELRKLYPAAAGSAQARDSGDQTRVAGPTPIAEFRAACELVGQEDPRVLRLELERSLGHRLLIMPSGTQGIWKAEAFVSPFEHDGHEGVKGEVGLLTPAPPRGQSCWWVLVQFGSRSLRFVEAGIAEPVGRGTVSSPPLIARSPIPGLWEDIVLYARDMDVEIWWARYIAAYPPSVIARSPHVPLFS
ncbi:hypothetical protein DL768_004424 [Monosporascus sp. mg162]|nr:hypothetical protein DL768_004424 [Monosporascus sp. mg162]